MRQRVTWAVRNRDAWDAFRNGGYLCTGPVKRPGAPEDFSSEGRIMFFERRQEGLVRVATARPRAKIQGAGVCKVLGWLNVFGGHPLCHDVNVSSCRQYIGTAS